MNPLILSEAGIVAVAKAVEAVAVYNTKLLEKVPEQAALQAELIKPWLKLAQAVNKALGIE
jgi:hypothetical protein